MSVYPSQTVMKTRPEEIFRFCRISVDQSSEVGRVAKNQNAKL